MSGLSPGAADPVDERDAGVTLVEQLVAMSIFLVVAAVFMTGLVSMTTSTSRTQNTADSGDAVRAAFLSMDRQVRYADAVNRPGRGASGDWYVEFRTPVTTAAASATCTQWRYDTTGGQLLMRTWNDDSTPGGSWTFLATVTKAPAAPPFTTSPATATQPFQRLAVDLRSGRGSGASAGGAQVQTSFTARNSSAASPSNRDADGDGRSDTPVCLAGTRS